MEVLFLVQVSFTLVQSLHGQLPVVIFFIVFSPACLLLLLPVAWFAFIVSFSCLLSICSVCVHAFDLLLFGTSALMVSDFSLCVCDVPGHCCCTHLSTHAPLTVSHRTWTCHAPRWPPTSYFPHISMVVKATSFLSRPCMLWPKSETSNLLEFWHYKV